MKREGSRTISPPKNFVSLQAKVELGTKQIQDECIKLMGTDELGRPYPGYYVLHTALVELRDRLKAEKKKRS